MMMKTSLSPAMRSKVEKVLGRVAIPERHDPTLAAGSQQARPDLQEEPIWKTTISEREMKEVTVE